MLFTSVQELLALQTWCRRGQKESCEVRCHDWQKKKKKPKAQVRIYESTTTVKHAGKCAKKTS